eukprot:3189195-Rhodomonas_salina.3
MQKRIKQRECNLQSLERSRARCRPVVGREQSSLFMTLSCAAKRRPSCSSPRLLSLSTTSFCVAFRCRPPLHHPLVGMRKVAVSKLLQLVTGGDGGGEDRGGEGGGGGSRWFKRRRRR